MKSSFHLAFPKQVYAGEDCLQHLSLLTAIHNRIVLMTDKGVRSAGLLEQVLPYLENETVEVTIMDDLASEPTIYQAEAVVHSVKKLQPSLIIAVGGGSVMDVAKLASVLVTDAYTIFDLVENPALAQKQLPTVMIPTTAGTGAEATPNAIVTLPEQALKVGIVHSSLMADYVFLSSAMTENLPASIAAATGMDALAHAVECFTSNKATPFSNLFALKAFELIESNLEEACRSNGCPEAKQNMLLASFYAGVAIACSGTTGVHALSYPLGGQFHIPHGISNAILLLPVLKFNEPACRELFAQLHSVYSPESDTLTVEKRSALFLARMEALVRNVGIVPSLKPYHVTLENLDQIVDSAMKVQRLLVNNRRKITEQDAKKIYMEVL